VPKTDYIALGDRTRIPVLYEDRAVLALDKPAGWILGPNTWERTRRNLQRAIDSCINGRWHFWVRSRGLKFLQFVHRLDAETSGVILFAKSQGALREITQVFRDRAVAKTYLAVVRGTPRCVAWTCKQKLGPVPGRPGYHCVDPGAGKEAETHFRVLQKATYATLVEARPVTGRTHQIRLHLLHAGHPVVGDSLYGPEAGNWGEARERGSPLALRAFRLAYRDPFRRVPVRIEAPCENFLAQFQFSAESIPAATEEIPRPQRHDFDSEEADESDEEDVESNDDAEGRQRDE
jgi:RluA family pseudouridine synthase